MDDKKAEMPDMSEAEKLKTQAETGGGRTMARPAGASGLATPLQPAGMAPSSAPMGGGFGSVAAETGSTGGGTSGMSGAPTNETMPGGGATGDSDQPDTVQP